MFLTLSRDQRHSLSHINDPVLSDEFELANVNGNGKVRLEDPKNGSTLTNGANMAEVHSYWRIKI